MRIAHSYHYLKKIFKIWSGFNIDNEVIENLI